MKDTEEFPTKIGVNEVCLFRKGSDIDLEAIFGGHIAGKRPNGIKTNPVYKDGLNVKKGNNSNLENDMGGIEIQVYNSIPKSIIETQDENMKKDLTKENSRTEVTVTNGSVCVGDIIIENGYRNPAFETDNLHEGSDVLEHTVKYSGEGETAGNMASSNWPDIDDIALPSVAETENGTTHANNDTYEMIDYNRNNTKVINEINPADIEIDVIDTVKVNESERLHKVSVDHVDEDPVIEVQTVTASSFVHNIESSNKIENKDKNCESTLEIGSNGKNESDECVLNDLSSSNETVKVKTDNGNIQTNELLHKSTNGSLSVDHTLNGLVDSNCCDEECVHEDTIVNEKEKAKKKNKKIKQRKNSLPDHILNSLNKQPSKPILIPVVVDNSAPAVGRSRSYDSTNEQKSVKFSDDTVFNDHKPNKYKQERVNLKDIYKGKISSKEAVAKLNPMFVDDNHSLTDDEKAERCGQNGLNTPAYMNDYVMSHGDHQISTLQRGALEADNDIESIGSEGAVNYDRLIKKTIAIKRQRKIIRLSCAVFTFLVVVAIVVVLVVFVGQTPS